MPTRKGSIRLFRLFGITVYLHWAWFVVAYFAVQYRMNLYHTPIFGLLEYLALFCFVLVHEFGHQLACRSVGGQTHDIVLWPLGGVAYVSPPQRPGATLWSITAGPLVNVVLLPLLLALWLLSRSAGLDQSFPDLYQFVFTLFFINLVLLIFNMLPIFPLDGGQIMRALLWFVIGRANSLLAASIIGFFGVAFLFIYAGWNFIHAADTGERTYAMLFGVMCAFITLNCWVGLRQAQALIKIANAPRRAGFACPGCRTPPPMGRFWRCSQCRQLFDTFETMAICPHCMTQYNVTACPECGVQRPITEWVGAPASPSQP